VSRTVLFISHSADLYGAQKSLLSLVNNLPQSIKPVVILPSKGVMQNALNSGIAVYVVRYLPWLSSRFRPIKGMLVRIVNYMAVRKICLICKEENVDVIYTNTISLPVGMMAAGKIRLPHILHIREYVGANENACFNVPEKTVTDLVDRTTRTIVCNSCSIESYYREKFRSSDFRVVYNGIEKVNESEPEKREPATILMVGYLDSRKNQVEAIDAMALLKERGVSAELLIAGGADSAYIELLREKIGENGLESSVKLLGPIGNVNELYRKCSCLLHCAVREPWGRVVVEAMMNRCLVVAADSDGVKEIVKNGYNGYIYEKGNIVQLADLLCQVLGVGKETDKIAENAFNDAISRFSIDAYVSSISDIIDKTISGDK